MYNISKKKISIITLAAILLALVFAASSCSDETGAEAAVRDDLEAMRFVEPDADVEAELETVLGPEAGERFEMFLGKAGEYEYEIMTSEDTGDDVIVQVRITTYDFASEYLRTWADFLEKYDQADADADKPKDVSNDPVEIAAEDIENELAKPESESAADGSVEKTDGYDTQALYETLFTNLSSIQEKTYISDVSITCTKDEEGSWKTDARENKELRNAIFGGMIGEMRTLAGLEE
jgi:hypothetical protein